jgi:hypothetical protein
VWRKEAQSAAVRYWAVVRAEDHSLAFGSYLYHLYLYSALVPGERNSNSTPAQSANVVCNFRATHRSINKFLKRLFKRVNSIEN